MSKLQSVTNLSVKINAVIKSVMDEFSAEDTFTYVEVTQAALVIFGPKEQYPSRQWKEAEIVADLATNAITKMGV